jgi:predicted DNA-binding protein (MmcQ/YjbR family)
VSEGHPVCPVARGDAAAVARLRALCLAFPDAVEKRSHGEPTWFAGKGKVFAMLDNHHHGAEHLAVWLPMPPGVQESLLAADPQRCFRPPYVGPAGWIGVVLDRKADWELVAKLLREAFLHVAGSRLRERLLAAPSTSEASSAPRSGRRPRGSGGSPGTPPARTRRS